MSNDLVNYEQQWSEQATEIASHERPSGAQFFSTRGGVLSLGDMQMPGNQICVVVMDFYRLNTYYGAKFDSDNPMPPVCYAFGRREEEMGPHISMQADLNYFRPQNNPAAVDACHTCQWNKWGTAETGRGKACQNRRELILVPAGIYQPRRGSRDFDLHLFDDPNHFLTADAAHIRLPVTSVNDWAKYVNMIAGQFRRPPVGMLTRIFLEPDPKSQYRVAFEVVQPVSDHLAAAVMRRQSEIMQQPPRGWAPPNADEQQSRGQSARTLRR